MRSVTGCVVHLATDGGQQTKRACALRASCIGDGVPSGGSRPAVCLQLHVCWLLLLVACDARDEAAKGKGARTVADSRRGSCGA